MNRFTEEEIYKFCLLTGRPYFGTHLHAVQGQILRHVFMRSLVVNEVVKHQGQPLNILEIGSWAGGSAITWADALKSAGSKGRVFCVDPWKPYARAENVQSADMRAMDQELGTGEIFPLFLHNIRTSGHEDVVIPIRGESREILPLLRRETFHIVYIDGDHRYEAVLSDINDSVDLIPPEGVLCGDDLELQVREIDLAEAEAKKHEDFIKDPKTGKHYHPGVTLAVGEAFEKVAVWEGFWAIRKSPPGWQLVESLKPQELITPAHLEPATIRLTFELTEHLKSLGLI